MKSFKQFLTEDKKSNENEFKAHQKLHVNSFASEYFHTMNNYKSASERLNEPLRNNRPFEYNSEHGSVSHLDHITNHPLHKDIIGYRNIMGEEGDRIKNLSVGEHVVDNGFTSVTLSKRHVKKWFMSPQHSHYTVIHIPKNTKGYYIDAHKGLPNSDEQEYVLRRGTHFKVTKQETKNESNPHYKVGPSGRPAKRKYYITHLEVVHQPENLNEPRLSKYAW